MKGFRSRDVVTIYTVLLVLVLPSLQQQAVGIKFSLFDKNEECFSHFVGFEGDTVHIYFVIGDSYDDYYDMGEKRRGQSWGKQKKRRKEDHNSLHWNWIEWC